MTPDFLSVIVVSYRMARELPRTLFTLSPPYQRGITSDEYEVILVDNGSPHPPTRNDFGHLDLDLRVLSMEDPTPSPVAAINRGLNQSSGRWIGVFIDGARMASPGLLAAARDALAISPRAVVASRGRYLGHEFQRAAIAKDYDQVAEDHLLERVKWWDDGYRLFAASVFDESSGPTWQSRIAETNSLFMPRAMWAELGGYDPVFKSPGGGLVNLDTWKRASHLPGARPVILLGEATFHQVHGGVATNGSEADIEVFFAEYEALRGAPFDFTPAPFTVHGNFTATPLPHEVAQWLPIPETTATSDEDSRIHRLLQRLPRPTRRRARQVLTLAAASARFGPRAAWRQRAIRHAHEQLVASSGLFDADWYLASYPDAARSDLAPLQHYLQCRGWPPRLPGPAFDTVWYLRANVDVAVGGINPLLHFLLHGRDEGRPWIPVYFE